MDVGYSIRSDNIVYINKECTEMNFKVTFTNKNDRTHSSLHYFFFVFDFPEENYVIW